MDGDPVYLDTSGLLAMMDADDVCHPRAASTWKALMDLRTVFVMTDYVRLEAWSLVQRRLGVEATQDLLLHVLPLCTVDPVGEDGFAALVRQVRLVNRRDLSLVDLSSFECMRRRGLRSAFAFDRHFQEQGFATPEDDAWPA